MGLRSWWLGTCTNGCYGRLLSIVINHVSGRGAFLCDSSGSPRAAAMQAPDVKVDETTDVTSNDGGHTDASLADEDEAMLTPSEEAPSASAAPASSGGSVRGLKGSSPRRASPLKRRGSNPPQTNTNTTADDQTAKLSTLKAENKYIMRDEEVAKVCEQLRDAIALRRKYKPQIEHDYTSVVPSESPVDPFEPQVSNGQLYSFEMRRGIMIVWPESEAKAAGPRPPGRRDDKPPAFDSPPSLSTYTRDLAKLISITSDAAVNSFCYRRLQKLEARFKLHVMEHESEETAEQRAVPHRDFYNVRKVDTHVHLAAAMNQKHLLRFIKRKVRYHADEVVTKSSSGEPMTLSQVFDEMGLTPYELNIDALGMHTDASTFARFDKFNLKYNPLGMSKLREIFIKTDNVCPARALKPHSLRATRLNDLRDRLS